VAGVIFLFVYASKLEHKGSVAAGIQVSQVLQLISPTTRTSKDADKLMDLISMLTLRSSRCVGEIQRARCFLRSLMAGLEDFSVITIDGCFESRRTQALKAALEIGL
jgi:hypothetical protein